MKKILLTMCLAATTLVTFAQSTTFGIKGGVNFSTLSITSGSADFKLNSGTFTSFNAGVFADIKFDQISIQPALNYTGKGGTFTESAGGITDKGTEKLYYLQLPVTVLYHVPVSIGDIYFGVGPYIGYGLSGKAVSTVTGDGETQSTSDNVKFGSGDNDDVKTTDFGATGQAGLKLKNGFLINFNYDLGLTNIANGADDGSKLKTRVFGIAVGYAF